MFLINLRGLLISVMSLVSFQSMASDINVSVEPGREAIIFGWPVFEKCVLVQGVGIVITEPPTNGRAFVAPNLTLSPVDPKCRDTPTVGKRDVFGSAPTLTYISNAGFKGTDSVEIEVQPAGPRFRYVISVN